jgi:hypothetical protein
MSDKKAVSFQYVGTVGDKEENQGPTRTKVFGINFERGGNPVEVTDEKIIAKLSGNPTFRIVEGGAKPKATGGGIKGGTEGPSIPEMKAALKAAKVTHGKKKEEVEAAYAELLKKQAEANAGAGTQ